jgi:hypothetical protein
MGGWWGTIQASERYSRVAAQARTDGRTRRWKVPTRPAGAGGSQVHAAPRASARAVPCRALRAGACVTGKGCRGLRRGGVVRETSRSRSQFNAAAGSRMRRLSLPGGRTARARADVLAGSVLWSPALDRGAGDGGGGGGGCCGWNVAVATYPKRRPAARVGACLWPSRTAGHRRRPAGASCTFRGCQGVVCCCWSLLSTFPIPVGHASSYALREVLPPAWP